MGLWLQYGENSSAASWPGQECVSENTVQDVDRRNIELLIRVTIGKNIQMIGPLSQVVNTASLAGIVGNAWAMADWHFGYGFPIGGVVATDIEAGALGGQYLPEELVLTLIAE